MTATATRPEVVTAVDPGIRRTYVRSPVDVLRLVVGIGLIVVGLVVAELLDGMLLGLSSDGASALEWGPGWVSDIPVVVLTVAMIAALVAALAVAFATTRYRRLGMMCVAFVVGAGLSIATSEVLDALVEQEVRDAYASAAAGVWLRELGGPLDPGDPLLAGSVAVVGVVATYLPRRVGRRLVLLLGAYAVVSAFASGVPAVGLVTDVGAGVVAASAVLLAFGRHDLTPAPSEIVRALEAVGITVVALEPAPVEDADPPSWSARTAAGGALTVKTFGRDERQADLLLRAYRWARFRKTGDHRPFVGLRRSVEREALVSLQVATLGLPTPVVRAVTGAGVDGMLLAREAVHGVRAAELDDPGDVLPAIWSLVADLHGHRIAHRDLRLGNVLIDADGRPWLVDLGRAVTAASDDQLGADVAELLASTAARVGPQRAAATAAATIDHAALVRATPWLQPLALSAATRRAVGGDDGLAPIRAELIGRWGVPEEAPVELERISGRTVFVLVTIGLTAWFLVPQLADIDNIWAQTRSASAEWAAVAVGFSILSYAAATASLLGAIPYRLRYGPALLAQVASSFANRITPAKVGGYATNVRYFQRQGVPAAVSVTAVGLNAVAGVVIHVLLTLTFLLLASGGHEAGRLTLPSGGTVAIALAVLLAIAASSVAVPVLRRAWVGLVLPQLRTGWAAIRTVGRSPGRLAMLVGGSAAITLSYLGAMLASLQAFGSDAPIPIVALLFLTGSAVANAAPTPGGLGAAEAALIAALSTVEDAAIVIPAVFLFRLVTFWLPILPGWIALTYLRRTDRL